MTDDLTDRTVATIRRIEGNELMPFVVRALAGGEPVSVQRLASLAGMSEDTVKQALARHPSVEWDALGRLVGFGITLNPTQHRFTFKDRIVYGWCASDALIFPVMLQEAGVVESTCPATGRAIRVEVTPDRVVSVDPGTAVVSKVRPDTEFVDVRSEICSLGHFFASREAAKAWLAAYPDGIVTSVQEDFEVHRLAQRRLGWSN